MQSDWEIHWEDYYKLLGLDVLADPDVVTAAYKKLAHKYHPDKKGDEEMFKKINRAYENLHNPDERKRYDVKWKDIHGRKSAQSTPDDDVVLDAPVPTTNPSQISIKDALPGKWYTASFIIDNIGGSYAGINLPNIESIPWLRGVEYVSLCDNDTLPLRVNIELMGGQWGKSYSENIIVRLDNEAIQIKVELQTKSVSIMSALWELFWLCEAIAGKISSFGPALWAILKNKYVIGALGVIILLNWSVYDTPRQDYSKQNTEQQQQGQNLVNKGESTSFDASSSVSTGQSLVNTSAAGKVLSAETTVEPSPASASETEINQNQTAAFAGSLSLKESSVDEMNTLSQKDPVTMLARLKGENKETIEYLSAAAGHGHKVLANLAEAGYAKEVITEVIDVVDLRKLSVYEMNTLSQKDPVTMLARLKGENKETIEYLSAAAGHGHKVLEYVHWSD